MYRIILLIIVSLFAGVVAVRADVVIEPLLKTSWKQRKDYARFTPNHERLGCWSVALGQILFHHRLLPSGKTEYTGKKYSVTGDFDRDRIELNRVVVRIGKKNSEAEKIETARYLWHAALVTGKDFGTGAYIGNTDVRRARLEKHYTVKTSRIRYPEKSRDAVEGFIITELKAGRPLLLYVEGKSESDEGSGHALVIDGFKRENETDLVHLNFGWEGVSDGWYDLWQPIGSRYGNFNKKERWIMAVRPLR